MRRAAFLVATVASVPLAARPAAAQTPVVDDLVAGFPGVPGIYARRLGAVAPAVRVRDGEPFPAASVIKLLIMVVAYRAFDVGTARPSDRVALRAADLIGGSPVLAGARPGEEHTLGWLIAAMIRASDNSAANTLITAFGFEAINGTGRAVGLTGTRLARHFAGEVPSWRRNENVTTPRDIGQLLYAIAHGAHEGLDTVAQGASCRAMIEVMLGQEYRDMIPAGIDRKVLVANKTGELEGVRNDAAIVDPFGGGPYVLVVLARDITGDGATRRAVARLAYRIDKAFRLPD